MKMCGQVTDWSNYHVYFKLIFIRVECTHAKWAHVESSGTGSDASSGNVVLPMVLPNSLPWLLYAATANTYFWFGSSPSTVRIHSPDTAGTLKHIKLDLLWSITTCKMAKTYHTKPDACSVKGKNFIIFPVPGRVQSPRRTFWQMPSAVRPQSWYQHTCKETEAQRDRYRKCLGLFACNCSR